MKRVTQYLSIVDLISFLTAIIGIIAGITITPYLYLLTAIAAFLPGLLRNIDILNDKDEYQREAHKTSGNMSFRMGGLLASVFAVGFKTGIIKQNEINSFETWTFFVIFLLLVYMIGYVTYFWGSPKSARLILITAGLFWVIFILLSGWANTQALGIGLTTATFIFFALPGLSLKWPRVTGIILILIALSFIIFLTIKGINLIQIGSIAIITLLLIPILIPGFILINRTKGEEDVE